MTSDLELRELMDAVNNLLVEIDDNVTGEFDSVLFSIKLLRLRELHAKIEARNDH